MSAAAATVSIRAHPAIPVLVVGCELEDFSALKSILGPDCVLHRVSQKANAVRALARNRPWVVVCDEILADGDWRDVLMELQAMEQAPPMIVTSRLADDRLWAEVLNLGGYDLLAKPFNAAEVSRVLKMAGRRGKITETLV